MADTDEKDRGVEEAEHLASKGDGPGPTFVTQLLRIGVSLAVPLIALGILYWAGTVVLDEDANRLLVVLVALIIGVIGVFALFYAMDWLVNRLPEHYHEYVQPFVFVGPALVLLSVFLVYPTIVTLKLSFQNRNGDSFVGLDNYIEIFTDSGTLEAIRNSILWVIFVPAVAVGIGLTFAVLSDKLGSKGEAISKSFIFMPMAISFVGASIVWRFVYNFRPEGFGEQIGILNGIWSGLGNEPVAWLLQEPFNNFYLMVILVWLQVGFAMVILSAGIKGVPEEIIEAGRIDGANEFQVFWRIIIPSISSTLVVVLTTIVITVWKVFDIVFVMTSGEFGTSVVAERMVSEFFTFGNDGKGAALAVVLLVAIVPLMVLNVRRFQAQEAQR
ncbi:MAG: sugar ABC transporter permease [Acidimicrobiia bacterium]|nr:MAG: sugar ABC transporter permease [Acidimicrobiia bacterium]